MSVKRSPDRVHAGVIHRPTDVAGFGGWSRRSAIWPHGRPAPDRRIVSEDWVRASTTIDSAIREPGCPLVGDHEFGLGYGYQWWIPAGNRGD